MWDYVLFDLDGTLTDPKEGITKSVQYALKRHGINIEDPDALRHFIGPPLRESFKKYYGFDDAGAERAVEEYREYFSAKGIYENTLYEGVPEMLAKLKSRGKSIILATSKPFVFAEKILEYFNIDACFDFISGSELDGRRSKKAEVIEYAIKGHNITEPEAAVMVGDRKHDIIGANEMGIASIGVLYGYGSREELSRAGAGRIVESVSELLDALL